MGYRGHATKPTTIPLWPHREKRYVRSGVARRCSQYILTTRPGTVCALTLFRTKARVYHPGKWTPRRIGGINQQLPGFSNYCPFRDGSTHVVLEPLDFIARFAVSVAGLIITTQAWWPGSRRMRPPCRWPPGWNGWNGQHDVRRPAPSKTGVRESLVRPHLKETPQLWRGFFLARSISCRPSLRPTPAGTDRALSHLQ